MLEDSSQKLLGELKGLVKKYSSSTPSRIQQAPCTVAVLQPQETLDDTQLRMEPQQLQEGADGSIEGPLDVSISISRSKKSTSGGNIDSIETVENHNSFFLPGRNKVSMKTWFSYLISITIILIPFN